MTSTIGKLVVLAAASVGIAAAQPNLDALKSYLSLSDTQIASLRQIRETERTEIRAVQDGVRDKSRALREHQRNGTGDAMTLGQLMVDVRDARKQIEPIRTRAHDQALALLTPDQRAKITELETAAQRRRELRQAGQLGLLNRAAPNRPGRRR